MSDIINDPAVLAAQQASQAAMNESVTPNLLTIDFDENDNISIVIRQGVSTWQALGALEVAQHILRSSYTAK